MTGRQLIEWLQNYSHLDEEVVIIDENERKYYSIEQLQRYNDGTEKKVIIVPDR